MLLYQFTTLTQPAPSSLAFPITINSRGDSTSSPISLIGFSIACLTLHAIAGIRGLVSPTRPRLTSIFLLDGRPDHLEGVTPTPLDSLLNPPGRHKLDPCRAYQRQAPGQRIPLVMRDNVRPSQFATSDSYAVL